MSTTRPLLVDSGGQREAEIVDESAELRQELADLREEFEQFKRSIEADRANLGRMLHGLRSVFSGGAAPASTPMESGSPRPHSPSAWQAWEEQLPPSCGKVIDALMVQPLTRTQMIALCRMDYSTVKKAVSILERNSLVEQ